MYIPEFWCGVIITVLAEVGAFILYCIFQSGRKKGGTDEKFES